MSLQIVLGGRKRIIVCSDSRGTYENKPPREDCQKLFSSGSRSACGIGGMLELGLSHPDSSASRVSRLCSLEDLRDSPRKLLLAIRDEVLVPIHQRLAANHESFKWMVPDGFAYAFSAFCIKRSATGAVDFWELRIPLHEHDSIPALGEPELDAHIDGVVPRGPFVFNICCPVATGIEKQVDPDGSDESVLRDVDTIFEAIGQETAAGVGGPIDVIAIDSTGSRWLRSKAAVAVGTGN